MHAFEHLQESPPDSWAFLNQDYLIRHPEANTKTADITSNASPSPSSEVLAGEPIGAKPKKRNGYQSRPVGGPLTPKLDAKKSNIWVVSKKMSTVAGTAVTNLNESNLAVDGVTSSKLSSDKSTSRYQNILVNKMNIFYQFEFIFDHTYMAFTNYTYFINNILIIVRLSHSCTVLEEKVLMTEATQAHPVVSTLLFLPEELVYKLFFLYKSSACRVQSSYLKFSCYSLLVFSSASEKNSHILKRRIILQHFSTKCSS